MNEPRSALPFWLAIALVLLAGCRSTKDPFAEDPELEGLKSRAPRLSSLEVAIAPFTLEYETRRAEAAIDTEPGWSPVAPDPITWRRGLSESLKEHARIGAAAPLDYASEKSRSDLLVQALDNDVDVMLQINLTKYRHEFRGRNGLFWPNMMIWWLVWVPSFFVNDEDFGAVLEGEAEVIDVRSEESVLTVPLDVDELISLDDFERGFDVFGFLTAPSNLDGDNWETIDETLGPMVERRVALEVVKGVLRDFAAKANDLPATVFGVVASVPKYKDAVTVPAVPAATRDAERFYSAAVISAGIPEKNVTTLDGDRATRASIEAAIRQAAHRARRQDTLLLFFAGAGTQTGEDLYLLPYDADPTALPTTAIALDELGRWLKDSPVARVLVMIDSSFAAQPGLPRTLAGAGGTLDPALEISRAAPGRQVFVLTAGESGEGAHDLAGKSQGLFTFYLVKGITGAANTDRNATLTLEELRAYVAQYVSDQAGLDGQRQHPTLHATIEDAAARDAWVPRAKVPFHGN